MKKRWVKILSAPIAEAGSPKEQESGSNPHRALLITEVMRLSPMPRHLALCGHTIPAIGGRF
jgi:hypothetical protein